MSSFEQFNISLKATLTLITLTCTAKILVKWFLQGMKDEFVFCRPSFVQCYYK